MQAQKQYKCKICQGPVTTRNWMCDLCARSYDRYSFGDESVRGAIEWAAKRARYFERKRKKK